MGTGKTAVRRKKRGEGSWSTGRWKVKEICSRDQICGCQESGGGRGMDRSLALVDASYYTQNG